MRSQSVRGGAIQYYIFANAYCSIYMRASEQTQPHPNLPSLPTDPLSIIPTILRRHSILDIPHASVAREHSRKFRDRACKTCSHSSGNRWKTFPGYLVGLIHFPSGYTQRGADWGWHGMAFDVTALKGK